LAKHGVCQLPNKYGKGKKNQSTTVPHYSLGKNENCGPTLFPGDFFPSRADFDLSRGFLRAVAGVSSRGRGVARLPRQQVARQRCASTILNATIPP